MIKIREEREADYDAVRIVNDRAFGTPEEGKIIEKLRKAYQEIVSLVAVLGEKRKPNYFSRPFGSESGF